MRRADVDEVDGFQEGGIKKMWEMWERKKKKGKMSEKRGNDVKRGRGHWRKMLRKTERERLGGECAVHTECNICSSIPLT